MSAQISFKAKELYYFQAFCSELPVFQRENWNGMYRTDVYFLAKVFAELPFYLFFPTILVCISYYMVGLHDNWESFVLTIGIMILVTNVTTNFGKIYFSSYVNVK